MRHGGASGAPPPRPHASGDAWVTAPDGRRFWGTFGAAGLLVHDDRGVLLQHRVEWSHFGGTWGIPGGARHESETAIEGALRESAEEAGVPAESLSLEFASVLDLGIWSYTTVIARATRRFEAVIGDAESIELRWIPLDEVDGLPLHPAFAAQWPQLRQLIERPLVLVVDSANVVGSRPNGWWRDRAGATKSLLQSLVVLAEHGLSGSSIEVPVDICWPSLVVVTEGRARDAGDPSASPNPVGVTPSSAPPAFSVVRAAGSGDDALVELVDEAVSSGATVFVVTADRALRERVVAQHVHALGPLWLWEQIDRSASLD